VARSPADALSPEVRAGYEALRRRFIAGLPERWREIEDAVDPAARAAVLHRLAGAAGAYGCGELGQAARSAEQLAATADGAAFERALAEVGRLLHQAATPPR
jgi:HPt (histidine-containing phosphotransfer) domain-containing protein